MQISLPEFDSKIVFSPAQLEVLVTFFEQSHYSSCLVLSDHHVFSLYGSSLNKFPIPTHHFVIPAGEEAKTLQTAERCWIDMHKIGLDRHSLVIGLGGGVVTDLAGYVASCYMRGIDVVHIPTSLLGMVDASLGGKTGVNLPSGKNLVGTFFHPKLVVIATEFLSTLPARELRSGLAEVIKYGVIQDPDLFDYLERHMDDILSCQKEALEHIIKASCTIKTEIVKQDPQEEGLRAILNFGHTFGHAIESATNYKLYTHGEAVAIGMCCAARLSYTMQLTDQETVQRIEKLCAKAGLPTQLPSDLPPEKLVHLMKGDKKNLYGKISLILVKEIGTVIKVADIEIGLIKEGLTLK